MTEILITTVLITFCALYAGLNIMYVLTVLFLDLGDKLKSDEVSIMRKNNFLTYLLFVPGKVVITIWALLLLILGSVSCIAILTIYTAIDKLSKNKF